jgi:hypothetical protein
MLTSVQLDIVLIFMQGSANIISVHLATWVVSVQDRCTICAKHTIGSEILLDAPDGPPR